MKTTLTKKKPLVQSVERALDILDLLADGGKAMRSVEIASALGLNANTAHNLVRTLFRRGYLVQHDDSRYFLGPQCYHIGTFADLWQLLRHVALPLLEKLSRETGDNAFLGVNAGNELICVTQAQGTGTVIVSEKQEWLEQFHCTASGKILLAFRHPVLMERLKGLGDLVRNTSRTITDWYELEKEVELTAERAYSLCTDEGAEGIAAIGVPVLDRRGAILASLSQSFPSYFLATEKISISKRVKVLNHYAGEIASHYEKDPASIYLWRPGDVNGANG